jgi:hypothetical protein
MVILDTDSRMHIGAHIWIGASAEQEFYHVAVGFHYRRVQGAPPKGQSVDLSAVVQKKLHDLW